MVTQSALRNALEIELRGHDVERAYLFGSYARGDQTSESDVDLRFQCGRGISFGELYDIKLALEDRLGVELDIVTAPPSQMSPRFREHACRDEVLLYEAV